MYLSRIFYTRYIFLNAWPKAECTFDPRRDLAKTEDLAKLIYLIITNYKENKKQEQILYLFNSSVVG